MSTDFSQYASRFAQYAQDLAAMEREYRAKYAIPDDEPDWYLGSFSTYRLNEMLEHYTHELTRLRAQEPDGDIAAAINANTQESIEIAISNVRAVLERRQARAQEKI